MKAIMMFLLALAVGLLAGCSGLIDSTKEKAVNMQLGIYGGKVVMSDPTTGNGSPSFQMGVGDIDYHSVPVKAGQSFKARRTSWSIWGDHRASETVIEVGGLNNYTVTTKDIPAGVVDFSADGVKTNKLIVKAVASYPSAESDTSSMSDTGGAK